MHNVRNLPSQHHTELFCLHLEYCKLSHLHNLPLFFWTFTTLLFKCLFILASSTLTHGCDHTACGLFKCHILVRQLLALLFFLSLNRIQLCQNSFLVCIWKVKGNNIRIIFLMYDYFLRFREKKMRSAVECSSLMEDFLII